ncbi:hypothetical protein FSP39_013660 [Pinctada imbricata]|uniref:ATP-dependent DNA helicase n=1 Tax=Pinctada imbricata TaxID=66713 RepID=A0AA89C6T6_PINIB|nr:hypothetical protein FSP39_013660 [Pinctada imbricata]
MVREGHNLLILGQSGTGKSFLTQKIASALRKAGKHVNLTATTGIAALGINGKTIHSWCGVGDGSISQDKLLQNLENNKNYLKQRNNILQTHCLIIDEISMLNVYIQLPVSLAFSITIHKAQGLTLERIEVDASNIFSPGQLGVAVGRTTAKKHLRIQNFHPSAVIKQPDCIFDFYRNSDCLLEEEYEDSQTCCKSNIFVNMDQNAEIDFGENYQYPDSELSDFDENDIQNIDDILLEQEESGEGFKVFEEKLRAKITEIFSMVHGNSGNSTTSKSWTKYYSEIYKFSISNDYEKLVEEEFQTKALIYRI